uniref:Uncharacterized protein n=1 Tax=Arundo donax TaxID=35708 RepID=A0A0A8Z045_ARUDO
MFTMVSYAPFGIRLSFKTPILKAVFPGP